MQEIPKRQILSRIALENSWWQPPHHVPDHFTQWSPRPYIQLFYPILVGLGVKRAPVLMGPRRVGKTYLLHHCIARLLDDGFPANRICYISVDTPTFVNQSLEDLLALYQEAAGLSLTDTTEPAYVMFDEIQYLREWERHLKSLVDAYPHVRFTASGSAAAALKLKSRESGAGRFTDFLLPPLTFYEYLELTNQPNLVHSVLQDTVAAYKEESIEELNRHFHNYIGFGGYPEAAVSEDIRAAPARFIKSDIIEKVLLRDIPQLYGITNVQELNSLFTSLAFNTAQECSLEQLSQRSGVTSPTVKKYIEYLEAAFLVSIVYRVDRSAKHFKRQRTFKVYLTNPSLRTALFGSSSQVEKAYGHLVETAIFAQWFHQEDQALHYARWSTGEVDLVNLTPENRWALEVKWSDRAFKDAGKVRKQVGFCAKNDIDSLTVTTRSKTGSRRSQDVQVSYWPASLYAYAVGHSIINYRVRAVQAQDTSASETPI